MGKVEKKVLFAGIPPSPPDPAHPVRKISFVNQFHIVLATNDHFTKTGSEQTQEWLREKRAISAGQESDVYSVRKRLMCAIVYQKRSLLPRKTRDST